MSTDLTIDLTPTKIKKIEKFITDEIAKIKVPGLAMAIVHRDKTIYSKSFGFQDLDTPTPASIDTIYQIASTTKSFVALAILMLEEQGKLDVQDPVNKYLPLELGFSEDPIRIHHLMNHTSGIPDLSNETYTYLLQAYNFPTAPDATMYPLGSLEDFFRLLNHASEYVTEKPGRKFYYNNFGYGMLGEIVEKVSGKSLADFTKEHIFDPLEMINTTFKLEDIKENKNLATPYMNYPQEKMGSKVTKIKYAPRYIKNVSDAPGGLFSTISDMKNYLEMHINKGKFKGNQVIKESILEKMHKSQIQSDTKAVKNLSNTFNLGTTSYGYGLFVSDDFYGYTKIDHGGNTLGGTADFFFLPERELGVVALANTVSGPRAMLTSVIALILGKDVEKIDPYFVIKDHYKKLTGIYEAYQGGAKLKVTSQGAKLYMEELHPDPFSLPKTPLFPFNQNELAPLEFYIPTVIGGKFSITFEIDDKDTIWVDIERNRRKKVKDN